jgi:uncharacterized protein YdiU (UPF0061 family)
LTNFEANAKQNEVKINNRFSEELPADADETMLRDRLKRFFLCYASNSIKSIFRRKLQHSLVFPSKTQNPMNSQTYFQERTVTPFRPYSMSYAGHQFGIGQVTGDGELLSSRNRK